MIGELSFNLGAVAILVVMLLALVGTFWALRWVVPLLPASTATKQTLLGTLIPIGEIFFGAIYVLLAVERLFRGSPLFVGIALVGVIFFGLWLFGDSLRDVVSGVMLRSGGSIGLGDRVQLDGLEGRVTGLGYRVLTLELGGGDESLIPYGQLSQAAIVRTPHVFGAHRHTFHLPSGSDPERIRQTVLLCHWSSVKRLPVIEALKDSVEVTVFALDPDEGPTVESFVRRNLGPA